MDVAWGGEARSIDGEVVPGVVPAAGRAGGSAAKVHEALVPAGSEGLGVFPGDRRAAEIQDMATMGWLSLIAPVEP